ncbi:MAG: hypothetical protein ACK52U_13895 [Synechococcaceae cyanobacterium]
MIAAATALLVLSNGIEIARLLPPLEIMTADTISVLRLRRTERKLGRLEPKPPD